MSAVRCGQRLPTRTLAIALVGLSLLGCGSGQTAPAGPSSAPGGVTSRSPESSAPEGSTAATFYDGFERAADNGWTVGVNDGADARRAVPLSRLEVQQNSPLQLVDAPTRDGHHALRATVPHALGSFRSEVAQQPVAMGSDQWYGFSIYVPSSWQEDPQTSILAQWHSILPASHDHGDGSGQPPVALALTGGQWRLKMHWNTQGPDYSGPGKGTATMTMGPLHTGIWTDVVLHARWSHGSDGLTRAWLNGHQVVDRAGPNEYTTERGPYFKIGIYHPDWKSFEADEFTADTSSTHALSVVDDAVRVASGPEAGYGSVAPR